MLTSVQQYLGIGRDVILILGIPTLLLVGRWLYEQRISALKEHIETLKAQLEESNVLRFDQAREIIEAQEALYGRQIAEKESLIARLGAATGQKEQEVRALQEEAAGLRQQLAALQEARESLPQEPDTYRYMSGREILAAVFQALGQVVVAQRHFADQQAANNRSAPQ